MFSPPRHQGHEVHPTTSFNAKAPRREDAKPTHPPIWPTVHADRRRYRPSTLQRRGAETQSRRGKLTRFFCVARFRPSDGRKPLGRESDTKARFRSGFPTQRPALEKRTPRHLSSPFNRWERHAPSPNNEKEEKQNRRASGTSADEKPVNDECLPSEVAGFSSVTGDPIACRSPATKRKLATGSVIAPLRLCALAPLRFLLDKWMSLRLRGSAPLRFSWCPPLVSWCLGGSRKRASRT